MSILTSTLAFACADETLLPTIEAQGLQSTGHGGILLYDHLDEAERICAGAILVVGRSAIRLPAVFEGHQVYTESIPAESIQNVAPYAPPRALAAAGGYVTRRRHNRIELLLIFRRGEWDLPKGKVDHGETIENAAIREVREELGVDDVQPGQPLGWSVHGYRHKGRFMVKTTHWFEMYVSGEEFSPERDEGIELVEWVPLAEAPHRLGYESLRLHTTRIAHLLA